MGEIQLWLIKTCFTYLLLILIQQCENMYDYSTGDRVSCRCWELGGLYKIWWEGRLKGCVCYICASLFFKSKRKLLSNGEKCFFYLESFFCSRENQIVEFYIFKFHDVIKCLSIKPNFRILHFQISCHQMPKQKTKNTFY